MILKRSLKLLIRIPTMTVLGAVNHEIVILGLLPGF